MPPLFRPHQLSAIKAHQQAKLQPQEDQDQKQGVVRNQAISRPQGFGSVKAHQQNKDQQIPPKLNNLFRRVLV